MANKPCHGNPTERPANNAPITMATGCVCVCVCGGGGGSAVAARLLAIFLFMERCTVKGEADGGNAQ